MALALPQTLVAGQNENVNHVQANFDALASSFPLAVNSTNFAAVPQVRAYHSGNQTVASVVANTASIALSLDSERYDMGTPSSNMHDTSTNNSRLTCRVAGLYALIGMFEFINSSAAGCPMAAEIKLNGMTVIARTHKFCISGEAVSMIVSTYYRLAVNDYVELCFSQGSTATLTVNSGTSYFTVGQTSPEFMAAMLSV